MIDRRGFCLMSAAGLALAAAPARARSSADAELHAFFEAVYQRDLARSPIRQSRRGIKTAQDRWDDISEARQLEDARLVREDLAVLRRFDPVALSPQARLSWRLFEHAAEAELRAGLWRRNDYLLSQMSGMHTRVPVTLMNSHPIETRKDAEDYLARLHGVGPLMDQLLVELRRQEAAGVKPPRFVYGHVMGAARNLLEGSPFGDGPDSPLLADFRGKLAAAGWPEAEQAALLDRAVAALRGPFADGYGALLAHLRDAERTAGDEDGVWKLPNGDAYYRHQLEAYTTLPQRPEDLHALGLAETAKIHDEMRAIAAAVGFTGDLPAFFDHMRTDPRFFYADTDEGRAAYLARTEQLLAEIRGRQDELLTVQPQAEVVVRPVEAWRAASAAKAFYQSPPTEGDAPGIFYINLYDMGAQPRYQLPVTLYHEAIPGHHVETVVAYELEDLPAFRKFASIAAFSEGWGLYAERLPREMGLYRDPYDDFGRLSLALMRSTRLVVDTGLHHLRWSREHAIAWLDANTAASTYDNRREVDRYIVLPGQAVSYYVGMMKILDLRERARARLGERFELAAFHDRVLGQGPLPLPFLEEQIEQWIETEAAR